MHIHWGARAHGALTHTLEKRRLKSNPFFRKYKLINNESAVWQHAQETRFSWEKEDIKWMESVEIPTKPTNQPTKKISKEWKKITCWQNTCTHTQRRIKGFFTFSLIFWCWFPSFFFFGQRSNTCSRAYTRSHTHTHWHWHIRAYTYAYTDLISMSNEELQNIMEIYRSFIMTFLFTMLFAMYSFLLAEKQSFVVVFFFNFVSTTLFDRILAYVVIATVISCVLCMDIFRCSS